MFSSKKRVAPSQGPTLHDFFGGNSGKSRSSLCKRAKSDSKINRPRVKTQHKTGLTVADAIVIEDDEEVMAFLDAPKAGASDISADCERITFGKPILLTSSPPPGDRPEVPEPEPDRYASERIVDDSLDDFVESEKPDENSASRSTAKEEVMDIDEWAPGDDEAIEDNGDGYGDDEENMIVDETKAFAGSCEKACPLCGTSIVGMTGMEVDKHVNDCIDASSSEKSGEKPDRKPLQPAETSRSKSSSSCEESNIFSVLMSGYKENEAWKEAAVVENKTFRPTKANGGRRKAPFYKVMPGMPIAVDAFRYGKIPGVTAYFLSHAHSDHYTNLSSSWQNGPIYCSITTANLIKHMLNVDPKWVHPLPNDTTIDVPNTGGVTVTLIEANHCPGSSLFLFEGRQTINAGDSTFKSPFIGSKRVFRYLHCGDFRACPQHVQHPAVKGKKIDQVYLDTTYLNPRYSFPPQPQVIDACSELARRVVNGENIVHVNGGGSEVSGTVDGWVKHPVKQEEGSADGEVKKEKILIVVGTYSIGKERIVKSIAKAVGSKIYCDSRKQRLLRCQDDPDLHSMLTNDPHAATVHLVPLQVINSDRLPEYVERWGRYSKTVGFRPTGWTYTPPTGTDMLPSIAHLISRDQKRTFTYANLKPMRNSTSRLMLYGVPYSEHSSFLELTCFALSFDWGKMIATVNVGNATSRGKMAKWFEKWESERRRLVGDKLSKVGVNSVSPGVGIIPFRRKDYW